MNRPLTTALAYAAMFDAGNRSMRSGGRTAWNEDDRDAAAAEFDRLLPAIVDWPWEVEDRPNKI